MAPVRIYRLAQETTKFRTKVLLVEDHCDNQRVTANILRNLGCTVDSASNAKEAVFLSGENPYAIIFMDCDMPGMDGHEAAREIRRIETDSQTRKQVPIIALAAGSLIGDREKRLAAGMDDYVPKPFDEDRIAAILDFWLAENLPSTKPHTCGINDSALDVLDSQPADPEIINCEALDNIRAMQTEGAEDLLTSIIKLFLEDTPEQLSMLHQALIDQDAAGVRFIAHRLKSSSATLGAESLYLPLKELEEKGRGKSLQGAAELLVRINDEFLKTIGPLRAKVVKQC